MQAKYLIGLLNFGYIVMIGKYVMKYIVYSLPLPMEEALQCLRHATPPREFQKHILYYC